MWTFYQQICIYEAMTDVRESQNNIGQISLARKRGLSIHSANIHTHIQWKPFRTKFVRMLISLECGCPMAPKIWWGGVY